MYNLPESLEQLTLIAAGKYYGAILELAQELDIFTRTGKQKLKLASAGACWEMPESSARIVAQSLCNLGALKYDQPELSLAPEYDKLIALPGERRIASAMLDTALDMKLFYHLKEKELSREELRSRLSLSPDGINTLINYLSENGLLKCHANSVSNSDLISCIFQNGQDEFKRIQRYSHFPWRRAHLREQLLDPSPQIWYMVRDNENQQSKGFYFNSHERRIRWGRELAEQYDFSKHQKLLDIGGATGGWCLGIREQNPTLNCTLFDISPATKIATSVLNDSNQAEHVRIHPGSFFEDELPGGHDVILLANLLHDWSPEDDRKIIKKAFRALSSGGKILIKETFFEDNLTGPVEALNQALMVLGPNGKSGWQPMYYEIEELLAEEGFSDFQRKENLVIALKAN